MMKEFTDFVVSSRKLTVPSDIKLEVLMGLVTESAEILDLYKKPYREGKGLNADKDRLKDEISDLLHYLISLIEIEEISIDEVIKHNIDKITKRHKTQNS